MKRVLDWARLIIDFGTATTFDAVSSDGEYLGCAIAPESGSSGMAIRMLTMVAIFDDLK